MTYLLQIRHKCIVAAMLTLINMGLSWAQSGTSSAISGTVTDIEGAVVI